MTEQEFDLEDAEEAAYEISAEAEQAHAALERGIGPGEAIDALTQLQRNVGSLIEYAESIDEAVNTLSGGSYSEGVEGLIEGSDDAYEHLNTIRDRAGVIERALEGDDGADGTLTIDGQEFEVSLTPLESDDETGDGIPTFGEWLAAQMNSKAVSRERICEESLVSEDRLDEIIGGAEPRGDEGRCIIKTLEDLGELSPEESTDARERYW